MGKVSVGVGGRSYALSCADGEEEHLAALGALLAAKADELTAAIGTMSEPRLLLMAGLQIADELVAARRGGTAAGPAGAAGAETRAGGTAAGETGGETAGETGDETGDDGAALAAILARVEALAAMMGV